MNMITNESRRQVERAPRSNVRLCIDQSMNVEVLSYVRCTVSRPPSICGRCQVPEIVSRIVIVNKVSRVTTSPKAYDRSLENHNEQPGFGGDLRFVYR